MPRHIESTQLVRSLNGFTLHRSLRSVWFVQHFMDEADLLGDRIAILAGTCCSYLLPHLFSGIAYSVQFALPIVVCLFGSDVRSERLLTSSLVSDFHLCSPTLCRRAAALRGHVAVSQGAVRHRVSILSAAPNCLPHFAVCSRLWLPVYLTRCWCGVAVIIWTWCEPPVPTPPTPVLLFLILTASFSASGCLRSLR
jgi:hypothetical protein